MSQKISPEDYRKILSSIELKSIHLKDVKAEYKEENTSAELNLIFSEKINFIQDNRCLTITFNFQLKAKNKETKTVPILINPTYVIRYDKIDEIEITEEFMAVFHEMTLVMLLWPYFRELISNIIYRMNLPPVILPLRKPLIKTPTVKNS
jgi:preprotein translocase subunit SecB